jgi:nitroreductase
MVYDNTRSTFCQHGNSEAVPKGIALFRNLFFVSPSIDERNRYLEVSAVTLAKAASDSELKYRLRLSSMDLIAAIKTRRSIRIFEDREVPKALIETIIDLARYAPSACNNQGARFIVIDDPGVKQKIVEEGGAISIKKAPVGILVLYDNQTRNFEYSDHIQSASAAIQNLILAAHHYGLGTCWICHLPSKRTLRRIFKIPHHFSPVAYVLLGFKLQEPKEVPRILPLQNLIGHNAFLFEEERRVSRMRLFLERNAMALFYLMPSFLKKGFLNEYINRKFVKKFEN